MVLLLFTIGTAISYAKEETKIVVAVQGNRTEVQAGDTFTAYIEAQDALDLFGLQLTLNYDSNMIQVVDNGIKFEKNMSIPGGEIEDFKGGSLTYPIINTQSTKDKVANIPVASITFKALKKGPVVLNLSNIKAVNSDIQEIHYNTQYQTALNITETSTIPPKDEDEPKKPSDPGNNDDNEEKPDDGKPSDNDKKETPKSEEKNLQKNKEETTNQNSKSTHKPGKSTGQSDSDVKDDSSSSDNNQDMSPQDSEETLIVDSRTREDDEKLEEESDSSSLPVEDSAGQDSEVNTEKTSQVKRWVIIVIMLIVLVGIIYLFINKDKVNRLINSVVNQSKKIRKG